MINSKNFFKKILISLLIVLTLFNFISSNIDYSFATDPPDNPQQIDDPQKTAADNDRMGGLINSVINIGGGLVGVIVNAIKVIIITPIRAMRNLNYTLASAGGTTQDMQKNEITPFQIFFNRFTLLDANIFTTTDRDGTELDQDSIVYKIRTNVAIWYYAIRTLAIGVVCIMLLWNLIRSISKNTSAEQKVVAKNAITDWVLSFALIMFMHIIIIVVMNFNDLMLNAIEGFTEIPELADFVDSLENVIFSENLTLSVAAMVVYALMEYQTFKYILVYIQRLFSLILLIIVSPIVPVTYSTDRMRGGRGAALNSWLKELVYGVFIQSVHALIYCAFVGVSLSALTDINVSTTDDLGVAMVAVASMLFVKYAEKIVKTIFGFNNSQIINTNIFSDTANVISNIGRTAGRASVRVAQGGPLISFGKNVDGSDIGIGQVANGLKNSARKTWDGTGGRVWNGAKSAGVKIKDGATGIYSDITGRSAAIDAAINYNDEYLNQATETERTSLHENDDDLSRKAEEGQKNLDKTVKEVSEKDKKEQQKEVNKEIKEALDEKEKEENKETEKSNNNETEEVKETNTETSSETVERINTREVEENPTEIENVEDDSDKEEDSIIISNVDQESLEKIKNELKEIYDSYKLRVDSAYGNTMLNSEKVEELGKNLNDDTKEAIEETIDRDNQVDNREFIDSLDGDEREYALYYDKMMKALKQYDGLQAEREEALEGLAKARNVDFSGANQSMSSLIANGDIDKFTAKEDRTEEIKVENSSESSPAPTVQLNSNDVTEANLPNNIENSGIEEQGKVESIDSVRMKSETKHAAKDLSKLGIKIHGKSEGEIQTEIQEDFDSRIEETEKQYGTGNLSEIAKKMSNQARQQLKDYKANKITENDLSDEAKSIAILEREATFLGYEMEVDNLNIGTSEENGEVRIQSRINGGKIKEYSGTVSRATGEVVKDLSQKRQEKVVSLSERKSQRDANRNSNGKKYA